MSLETELETYRHLGENARQQHTHEWVVISGKKILGYYKEFEEAALKAFAAFGDQPFLIRQIDAPPITVPQLILDS